MTNSQRSYILEQGDINLPSTNRPVVFGTQGIISSGHYLTSMAGMKMMTDGGNAFDAVVAAGFAAAVIEPIAAFSLAAEGVFMLYHADSGDLLAVSGQGVAPGKATPEFFKSKGFDEIPTGPGMDAPMSFTVPGVVHALLSILEKYGTKTVAEVLAPAIRCAEHGVPNYEYMLQRLGYPVAREQFNNFPPGGMDIFYDNGELPEPGSLLVQTALANTLRKIVSAEAGAVGTRVDGIRAARDCFYKGEVAAHIVDSAQSVGSILSMDDMASYSSKFEEPVKTSFMGHEVHGQSVWTQSAVLMQTLNILENFDLGEMGHNSPSYIHTVTEALLLAMADRQAYYTDPDFGTVPIDGLLSKEYAAERAKEIDPARTHGELPDAGDPYKYSTLSGTRARTPMAVGGDDGNGAGGDEGGTTHISVMDREGNIVCATPSGGSFGKSVFFPDLGCAISTRIEMLGLDEDHPNVVAPGKRPRTTLINYIMSKDGQPVMTVGCPGGDSQAQACVQLVLNTLLWGMNPQKAVEAPRFSTLSVQNSFYPHNYFPGRLTVEFGIPADTREALEALGHEVGEVAAAGMGATVSRRDPETGVMSTGADHRRACYAIGW